MMSDTASRALLLKHVAMATGWLPLMLVTPCAAFAAPPPLVFEQAMYSGPVGSFSGGRSAIGTDPLAYRVAMNDLAPPAEGEISGTSFRGGEQRWKPIDIADPHIFSAEDMRGGLLHLRCKAEDDEIVLLQPDGFSAIVMNGVYRTGDYYSKGRMLVPVKLSRGENSLWCRPGRGRAKRITVERPSQPVYLTEVDATLPDFLVAESGERLAAIRVVNASSNSIQGLKLVAHSGDRHISSTIPGHVSPLSVRKVPFKVFDWASAPGEQAIQIALFEGDRLVDEIELQVEVKEQGANYRRTFMSEVDGSVQYYGVREGMVKSDESPALVVSAHGAGVQAIRQAGSYKAKDWAHIIAPTNRREFGFDWEDWGRLDALEAIADAETHFQTDPNRTYLTGHSMGGHGTWHLGATYPDRWAAIAPIAGWRSFFSYTRRSEEKDPHPMAAIFDRASNASRTLQLVRNYRHQGVFIEHGDNDRNVPVSEARYMRARLAEYHPDFAYLEDSGAGHWYGVDHPPVFEYFQRHTKKDSRDIDVLEFRSACPGVSSSSHYITLYQQQQPFEFSGVVATQTVRSRRQHRDAQHIEQREIKIDTENLALFKVDLAHCDDLQKVSLVVDGESISDLPWPEASEVWLSKQGEHWTTVSRPNDPTQKSPQRYGGFKDAFRHNFLLIVATQGSDEENRWSYEKARYDAENFYYRGNASVEIVPDSEFTLDAYKDRSAIVYGNSTMNSAWKQLLSASPVQVSRTEMTIGPRTLERDDLGLYMIRPRPDSDIASVGVIAGTGLPGLRAANPCRYFISGAGFPDLMVFSSELHSKGADGVEVAGFFGNDWGIDSGTLVWASSSRETPAHAATSATSHIE